MKRSALGVGLGVPRFAPFRGGLETYVAVAAAGLAVRGIEITIITQVPRAAGLPRREVRNGCTIERHFLPVADIFEVPSLSAAQSVGRTGRFDVVWVHRYHTPLAWRTAEKACAPVIFTTHYHVVGHTPVRQTLHRACRPVGRRLVEVSRRIVGDTDAEADLVLRQSPREVPPEKITVYPGRARVGSTDGVLPLPTVPVFNGLDWFWGLSAVGAWRFWRRAGRYADLQHRIESDCCSESSIAEVRPGSISVPGVFA